MSFLVLFVFMFFSPFSIAITSLGEERANLSAFRTFVRFALVWFCLFSLPLGVWVGLRFVIMALPLLFSYLYHYVQLKIYYLALCCHCTYSGTFYICMRVTDEALLAETASLALKSSPCLKAYFLLAVRQNANN